VSERAVAQCPSRHTVGHFSLQEWSFQAINCTGTDNIK